MSNHKMKKGKKSDLFDTLQNLKAQYEDISIKRSDSNVAMLTVFLSWRNNTFWHELQQEGANYYNMSTSQKAAFNSKVQDRAEEITFLRSSIAREFHPSNEDIEAVSLLRVNCSSITATNILFCIDTLARKTLCDVGDAEALSSLSSSEIDEIGNKINKQVARDIAHYLMSAKETQPIPTEIDMSNSPELYRVCLETLSSTAIQSIEGIYTATLIDNSTMEEKSESKKEACSRVAAHQAALTQITITSLENAVQAYAHDLLPKNRLPINEEIFEEVPV